MQRTTKPTSRTHRRVPQTALVLSSRSRALRLTGVNAVSSSMPGLCAQGCTGVSAARADPGGSAIGPCPAQSRASHRSAAARPQRCRGWASPPPPGRARGRRGGCACLRGRQSGERRVCWHCWPSCSGFCRTARRTARERWMARSTNSPGSRRAVPDAIAKAVSSPPIRLSASSCDWLMFGAAAARARIWSSPKLTMMSSYAGVTFSPQTNSSSQPRALLPTVGAGTDVRSTARRGRPVRRVMTTASSGSGGERHGGSSSRRSVSRAGRGHRRRCEGGGRRRR